MQLLSGYLSHGSCFTTPVANDEKTGEEVCDFFEMECLPK